MFLEKFLPQKKDTNFTVLLPRVAGSRVYATLLTKDVKPYHDVLIDGRRMVLSGDSFADQLAKDLMQKSPRSVIVLGGGEDWPERITLAAKRYGLSIAFKPLTLA